MWVCRNVIGTTLMFDGLKFVPPIKNGDEWGMVYGIAIPTLQRVQSRMILNQGVEGTAKYC